MICGIRIVGMFFYALIFMTNNNISKYVCCSIRNILWQWGYSCIYALFSVIISALVAIIVWGVTYALTNVDSKDVAVELSSLTFPIVLVISLICFLYPIYKKSLHKVFFKPYKRFTLCPTIDKINCKITLQYLMISILINLPAIIYNIINYHNIMHNGIEIQEITPLIFIFVYELFVCPFIATTLVVKKYSKFS